MLAPGARARSLALRPFDMRMSGCRLLLLLLLADAALGLRVATTSRPRASTAMAMSSADRRSFLNQAAAVSGLCLTDLSGLPAYAADQRPVLVLGASGGTGRACVDYLLAQGRPCIAATRTGEFDARPSKLLTVARAPASSYLALALALALAGGYLALAPALALALTHPNQVARGDVTSSASMEALISPEARPRTRPA